MADWDLELAELEICFAVVKTLEEILTDPQLCEREMIHTYPGENGQQKHGFGIPVKLSDTPGSIRRAPGKFGEQTEDILGEIGYSTEQIDSFIANGVL